MGANEMELMEELALHFSASCTYFPPSPPTPVCLFQMHILPSFFFAFTLSLSPFLSLLKHAFTGSCESLGFWFLLHFTKLSTQR